MIVAEPHAAEFQRCRSAMFGAAYRILASSHDAEDVVQEAWLRWSEIDLAEIREPRAYLITIASRLALNRARQQQRRREDYVGPWLPEPVLGSRAMTDEDRGGLGGDPGEVVELAESVSLAMLVVLSTLSPLERATFVLKDVFDLPYEEIGATLGRSPATVRQLAHRARSHVQARAPRVSVDDEQRQQVTDRFLAAVQGGSMEELLQLLAPDAVLVTDGGGLKQAALRPITGADKIARFLGAIAGFVGAALRVRPVPVNGQPGVAVWIGDELDTVGVVDVVDGRAQHIYLIRNPEKLAGLAAVLGGPPDASSDASSDTSSDTSSDREGDSGPPMTDVTVDC